MWQTIQNVLTRILTALGAFFVGLESGKKGEQLKHARNTVDALKKSNKRIYALRRMSDAERMQWRQERGYLRDDEADYSKPE